MKPKPLSALNHLTVPIAICFVSLTERSNRTCCGPKRSPPRKSHAMNLSLLVAPPGELRTQQRAPGATIRQAHTESLETKTATGPTYHGFPAGGASGEI